MVLVAVFVAWQRTEQTLSIHSIDTPRRELFYWAAVVATFAMGTALGDLTATTLHLGYFASGLLFAGMIAVPAIGYWFFRWNADLLVLVRLRGHPAARGVVRRLDGQAAKLGGLGWGDGRWPWSLTSSSSAWSPSSPSPAATCSAALRERSPAVRWAAPPRARTDPSTAGSGPRHGAHSGASVPAMDYAQRDLPADYPGAQPGDYRRHGPEARSQDYWRPRPDAPPEDY